MRHANAVLGLRKHQVDEKKSIEEIDSFSYFKIKIVTVISNAEVVLSFVTMKLLRIHLVVFM